MRLLLGVRARCSVLVCRWSLVVGRWSLEECWATKARAGRPQRANPAVGPWGTDFPGLSGSGARRPFSSVRFAHCAQRRRVSCRSSLRSPPPNHSSPAPPTRAAACPPAPLRTTENVEGKACHRCCRKVVRGAGAARGQALRTAWDAEGLRAATFAGERLGVRARWAVGDGEDRRPGGGARSALRPSDSPALCAARLRAELNGRRAPGLRTGTESAPPGADRRIRPAVPAPRAARAHSTMQGPTRCYPDPPALWRSRRCRDPGHAGLDRKTPRDQEYASWNLQNGR